MKSNDVLSALKEQIAQREEELEKLHGALAILNGDVKHKATVSSKEKRPYTKSKSSKSRPITGDRFSELGLRVLRGGRIMGFREVIVPHLKASGRPLTAGEIFDDLFPGKRKKTKRKVMVKLQNVLWRLKKEGALVCEGVRGQGKGNCNMRFSVAQ